MSSAITSGGPALPGRGAWVQAPRDRAPPSAPASAVARIQLGGAIVFAMVTWVAVLRKARYPDNAVEKSNIAVGRDLDSTMHLRDKSPLRSSCCAPALIAAGFAIAVAACHREGATAPAAPAAAQNAPASPPPLSSL